MGRRCFLVAVLLLAVAASAAEPPIVGIYGWGTDPTARISRWDRFYSRLRELGWRDGENVRLQPRYGARDDAKGDAILREFVRAQVAVIVVTGTGEALAAQRATSTIPVVVLHMLDPVKLGLIQSLARPGGNITGRVQTVSGVSGKQLELIAQTIPSARRAVYGRGATGPKEHGEEISAAAKSLGLAYLESDLPRDRNFEPWVGQMKRVGVDVAVFILDGLTFPPPHNAALAAALIKHKLPAICAASEYADAGCLMSYGPVTLDHYARGAKARSAITATRAARNPRRGRPARELAPRSSPGGWFDAAWRVLPGRSKPGPRQRTTLRGAASARAYPVADTRGRSVKRGFTL
jgi:putative ABC transport system substrate-binding protein